MQRLRGARRLLKVLQGVVRRHGRDEDLLIERIETCANLAWLCHAGIFALPPVEQRLQEIRRVSREHDWWAESLRLLEGRTVHVVTETYAIGGHTRLLKRWIEHAEDASHAIVLVRQHQPFDRSWVIPEGQDVPVIDLAAQKLGPLAKVTLLKGIYQAAQRVILHIHPDDACAVAAAYRAADAEIHFVNHADHVAWLGAGLPALFLNLRGRGTRLAVARRGLSEEACGEVLLPISAPTLIDRDTARQALGFSPRDHLLLTVASAYKFTPVGSYSLFSPLDRLLARPEVKVMVVGAYRHHPLFARLAAQHPGQVHCAGHIPAPEMYRAAADIYFDSHPFGSFTSMLESAAMGTPVIALQPDIEALEILYSECPWLEWHEYAATDADSFVAKVERLLDHPEEREALGLRNREGMRLYAPSAWRAALKLHLDRAIARPIWRRENVCFEQQPLDQVLAGLMHDLPARLADPRALNLDAVGRLQLAL